MCYVTQTLVGISSAIMWCSLAPRAPISAGTSAAASSLPCIFGGRGGVPRLGSLGSGCVPSTGMVFAVPRHLCEWGDVSGSTVRRPVSQLPHGDCGWSASSGSIVSGRALDDSALTGARSWDAIPVGEGVRCSSVDGDAFEDPSSWVVDFREDLPESMECKQQYYRKLKARWLAIKGLQKLRKIDCGPDGNLWPKWRDLQIQRKKRKNYI